MDRFLSRLANGEKATLVALGDSITELTWHTRGRLNWVGYLQEGLFETYGRNLCWVINSGRCGDTAAGGLKRLDEDVLRFQPDLVIVSYGMNDSLGDLVEFRQAIGAIVDRIRAADNNTEVILRTPNPIVNPPWALNLAPGQEPAGETSGTSVGAFARTIVGIAQEKGCPVVDHYASWKKLEERRGAMAEEPNQLWLYMSDSVHPGPLGHLAFFRELAPLFRVPARFPWEAE